MSAMSTAFDPTRDYVSELIQRARRIRRSRRLRDARHLLLGAAGGLVPSVIAVAIIVWIVNK